MQKYVALLRGIGPGNPNMRNDKLRSFFEAQGLHNVQTVVSSGNVVFETEITDSQALELKLEKALPEELGFHSTVIIRSKKDIENAVASNSFKGMTHSNKTYLFVTFAKSSPQSDTKPPYTSEDKVYSVLHIHNQEIYSIADATSTKAPHLMRWLEKEFGTQITSRTYKTVERILKKFDQS